MQICWEIGAVCRGVGGSFTYQIFAKLVENGLSQPQFSLIYSSSEQSLINVQRRTGGSPDKMSGKAQISFTYSEWPTLEQIVDTIQILNPFHSGFVNIIHRSAYQSTRFSIRYPLVKWYVKMKKGRPYLWNRIIPHSSGSPLSSRVLQDWVMRLAWVSDSLIEVLKYFPFLWGIVVVLQNHNIQKMYNFLFLRFIEHFAQY